MKRSLKRYNAKYTNSFIEKQNLEKIDLNNSSKTTHLSEHF
jgi:hypothetical protein